MSVKEELRDLVAASSAQVLAAIDLAPDDDAFTTARGPAGKTAADYALQVAQDKAGLLVGLGGPTVEIPPAFTTKEQATSVIGGVEQALEDQILALDNDDFEKTPPALGYPIDCDLPTYYDCVVAHSQRDSERAQLIRAIFES